jgi:hypothetical protein
MLARVRFAPERLMPHGLNDVLRQILLFGFTYYVYSLVRGAANGQAVAAFQHARQLISLERTLHVFIEPSIQAWASGSHLLIAVSTWVYINAQSSITLAALAFLYLFHNQRFYFVRNMFVVAMVVALLGYVLYPTAPPRMLPEWGFFDSVSDLTGVHPDNASVNSFFNQYAAVPSMHVGFAVMIGVTMARVIGSWLARACWLIYPLVITFVTVVTANHYLIDAVFGAITAGLAALAATWLAHTRPEVWRFSPAAGAEASAAGAPAEASATA